MDILKTISAAGLTVTEAAKLYAVAKPTIYNWAKGRLPNNAAISSRMHSITARLEAATSQGRLPLPSDIKRAERFAVIRRIITDVAL